MLADTPYLLAKVRPQMPRHPVADVQPWVYSGNRTHPTEKAPEVFKPPIESLSKPSDVILDPFACSGSTLVAVQRLGLRIIGVELDADDARQPNNRLRRLELEARAEA